MIGVAMYFVFGPLMTVGLERERMENQGRIEALVTESLGRSSKVSKEEASAILGKARATVSHLWALHKRSVEIHQEVRAKRFWAVVIGLVAGAGCFALCSVHWAGRKATNLPETPAPAAGRQENSPPA